MAEGTNFKSNGKYVERIEIEYDPGNIVRANIHLTAHKNNAYNFTEEENKKIKGFLHLEEIS